MSCDERSCIDCGVINCLNENSKFPGFCPTANMDPEVMEKVRELYNDPENLKFMQTAASVEYDGYCRWPRVYETVEFCKRMGFKKIGIATCVGLIKESNTLAKIFRSHGFDVYGIGCKVGTIPKVDVGIPEQYTEIGRCICNPIMQAELLGRAGTEFNLVVGLCVGHDTIFYKYSKAPVTTIITKDRVTCHNPAAVLYSGFYTKKLYGDK